MPGSSNKREAPDVIVIEDNDKESEVEDEGSRSYTKINSSEYRKSSARHGSADPNRAPPKPSIDSSDEEDCVVVEPSPRRKSSSSNKRFPDAKKRPRHAAHPRFNLRRKNGRPNESSDSDVIVDFNGTVRRNWEEAALRRRMANMYNTSSFRAESEESASVANHAKNDGRQSRMGRQRGDTHGFKTPEETDQSNGSGVSPAGAGATHAKEGQDLRSGFDQQSSNPGVLDAQSGDQPIASEVPPAGANSSDGGVNAASDQQSSNPVVSGTQLDDTVEATSLAETAPISAGHNVESFANGLDTVMTEADDDLLMESGQKTEEDVEASRSVGDPHLGNPQDAEAAVNPVNGDTIVSGREQLKETEEFRQAVAEEWARRQLELQKQAQEAARERKRRKLEAERKLGMEVRQRQRLEEIRQSQLKEEQTLDLKEQLRGQIHSKLERLGATCRDMATLLRRLGISVDGGAFPTTQQVNAAYKKALLRFHPDRMAALVKRDPSHQVEAEETFKLISRMKGVLPPVAARFF